MAKKRHSARWIYKKTTTSFHEYQRFKVQTKPALKLRPQHRSKSRLGHPEEEMPAGLENKKIWIGQTEQRFAITQERNLKNQFLILYDWIMHLKIKNGNILSTDAQSQTNGHPSALLY